MAEHVHTTYTCDRCSADLGSERPNRPQKTRVTADFHWPEGPGPSFCWSDLCDACDETIKAFFLRANLYPKSGEKIEARAWFTEMLGWANTDTADHIMVRAKRMIGPRDGK